MAASTNAAVVAIFGPTASGKTAVAEAIADLVPAEIVSADSMQLYRGLPILTNQPDRPTHLVAIWELDHTASVAEYARLAHETIDDILGRGLLPVVVGGTGLYLRAALADLKIPAASREGARERWTQVYDELGAAATHGILADRDPTAAAAVHANDRRRVIRALELVDAGTSLRPVDDRLWTGPLRHPTLLVGLDVAVAELNARIDARARQMLERGAAAEARRARVGKLSSTAEKVIGLREAAELDTHGACAAISLKTRRYAAYQRKWMRRIEHLASVNGERPPRDVALEILDLAGRGEPLSPRRSS